MADNFQRCLEFVLKVEGGWSDNPDDDGGCTMRGITLAAFRQWKQNPKITCAQLYVISLPDVTKFYYEQYWMPLLVQKMAAGVDLMVMDAGVNMGISGSARLLQKQVGVTVDGHIGAITLDAAAAIDARVLIDALAAAQSQFYHGLDDFKSFGKGWIARVNARHATAITMIQ